MGSTVIAMEAAEPRGASIAGRVTWAAAALLIALVLLSFYQHPIGWIAGTGVAALLVLAVMRPYEALLLLAALGPLSTILFILARVGAGGLRIFEAMTLAVAAGWAARHALRPAALRIAPALLYPAATLLALAVASAIISSFVTLEEQFGTLTGGLLAGGVFRAYAVNWDAVSAAMLFAEGLILLLVAADICAGDSRRREGVLRMMVAGAASAAAFNVLRIVTVSLAREHPWQEFQNFVISLRVNVHHGDLNAAGSYFAMMLFVALAIARRTRVAGVLGAVLILAALWIAGSRTALAAAGVTSVVAGLARVPAGRARRVTAVLAVVLLGAAAFTLWTRYQSDRHVATPAMAASIRLGLAQAALRMTADNPLFGVGLGHFFERSEHYARGPFYQGPRGHVVRENAHNNFLQILGELGIPGLTLWLAIIGAALWASLGHADQWSWGLAAGIAAYLLSCLGGHPLMIAHSAYPFWMAVGVAAAHRADVLTDSRRLKGAAIVLVLGIAIALPFRTAAAVRHANVEHTSIGFSQWQREPDGSRYRWAGGRSTFFVPSSAQSVRIPLGYGTEGPERLEVRIFLNGREANRIVLERSEEWRSVHLPLPRRISEPFARIDLEAGMPGALAPLEVAPTDTGGLLRVGRPAIRERE